MSANTNTPAFASLVIVPMKSDGNCLFHSTVYMLRKRGIKMTVTELRKQVITRTMEIAHDGLNDSAKLVKGKQWDSDLMDYAIFTISDMFHVRIIVYNPTDVGYYTIEVGTGEAGTGDDTWYFHLADGHYDVCELADTVKTIKTKAVVRTVRTIKTVRTKTTKTTKTIVKPLKTLLPKTQCTKMITRTRQCPAYAEGGKPCCAKHT
jgi:OTU-like cysteine protease